MATKRALIFSFVYYPRFIGGAEIAVKEITDRIDPEEIEFHLIALRLDSALPYEEKIGNVHVHRIGWSVKKPVSADSLPLYLHLNKFLYPLMALLKTVSLQRKYHFDFTWAIMANYSGFAALLFKLTHTRIPFLLTLQEGDPLEYISKKVRFVRPFFNMIFTKANLIQAISGYLGEWAKSMGGKNIVIVPNGVDVAHFSKELTSEASKTVEVEIDKKPGEILIVTTSRLVVKNAVEDIISALSYLPENIKLLIIGQGYLEPELKAQAKEAGVFERVIFRGFVSHKDLPMYLKVSDIFIRPSLSEGFGNSFIEAMAARIPVIATRVGGIPDFLNDKKTGLFCEVSNPEDIARKVGVFLSDKNLREEIIDCAFRMVNDRYDWNRVANDMREKAFDILKA